MKNLAWKVAQGYIRHTLTGFGGAMVAQGVLTSNDATAIVGGAMALIGALWSHFNKLPTDQDNGATTN